jgi:hypothetical protein
MLYYILWCLNLVLNPIHLRQKNPCYITDCPSVHGGRPWHGPRFVTLLNTYILLYWVDPTTETVIIPASYTVVTIKKRGKLPWTRNIIFLKTNYQT